MVRTVMNVGDSAYMYCTAIPLASSFLPGVREGMEPIAPNGNRRVMDGSCPCQIVYGSVPVVECLVMLYLKMASRTASSQNMRGRSAWNRDALAAFIRIAFMRSAMPFSCGE